MKRILVVANDFPYPPSHGAAVDMWTRIVALAEMGYQIDLVISVREIPDEAAMNKVREVVGKIWIVPRRTGVLSLLSFLPFQVMSRSALKNLKLDGQYDAAILESEITGAFLKNPTAKKTRIILRIHNEQVSFFREFAVGATSWLKKLYFYTESFKFRFFSPSVRRDCDLLWFISDSEREDHVCANPQDDRKSFFIPSHASQSSLRPFVAGGSTTLFIGSLTISHNTDAVEWYIANIHPRLEDIEGYRFQVAGRTGGQPIPQLRKIAKEHSNVLVETDPVVLDTLYENAAVFVNPVIYGAGVKIKVIQALQAGMPLVSTTLGIEGTGFKHGEHLLVGDTPEEFAACVRRLIMVPALAESLVHNAQAFLAECYDMKVNMQKVFSDLPG